MMKTSYEKNKQKAETIMQLMTAIEQQIAGTMDLVRACEFWKQTLPALDLQLLAESLSHVIVQKAREQIDHKKIRFEHITIQDDYPQNHELRTEIFKAYRQQISGLMDFVTTRAYWETRLTLCSQSDLPSILASCLCRQ